MKVVTRPGSKMPITNGQGPTLRRLISPKAISTTAHMNSAATARRNTITSHTPT